MYYNRYILRFVALCAVIHIHFPHEKSGWCGQTLRQRFHSGMNAKWLIGTKATINTCKA